MNCSQHSGIFAGLVRRAGPQPEYGPGLGFSFDPCGAAVQGVHAQKHVPQQGLGPGSVPTSGSAAHTVCTGRRL